MKEIKYFYLDYCPHCRNANLILEKLLKEDRYKDLKINSIEESKNAELADQYDYYYVPTFYVDEVKCCEGSLTEDQIREVLENAL